jgi:hypothetical protein
MMQLTNDYPIDMEITMTTKGSRGLYTMLSTREAAALPFPRHPGGSLKTAEELGIVLIISIMMKTRMKMRI